MFRAIIVMGVASISCAFTWPPEYVEQSRADVATCVSYARLTSPAFDAQVRGVDLQTGKVDITSSPGDSRGERAFSKCLLSVRQWRLIDRHLPKPTEPPPMEPPSMAGRTPDTVSR